MRTKFTRTKQKQTIFTLYISSLNYIIFNGVENGEWRQRKKIQIKFNLNNINCVEQ